MKKYLSIIIILIAITQKSAGQETVFKINNARDYATAKIVYVYLNEYFLNPNSAHNDAYDDKKLNFNLIKNLFEKNTIEYPVPIDSISGILCSFGFNNLDTLFVRKVKGITIENSKPDSEIANSLVESIYAVNFNITSSVKVNEIKYVLKKEIENYFHTSTVRREIPIDKSIQKIESIEPSDKPDFTTIGLIICSVLISVIICLVLGFIFYLKLNNRYTRHRQEIDQLNSSKIISIPNLKFNPSDLRLLNDKIKDLEFSLKDVQNKFLNFIKGTAPQPNSNLSNVKPETKSIDFTDINTKQEKVTETFYLHSPFYDSFLNNTKSVGVKSGLFSYKFTVYEDKKKAHFELICNGESLQMINSNRKKVELLQPACNIENNGSDVVTNILTTNRGIAILEGESWKIIKKAIIKFEYGIYKKQPTNIILTQSNNTDKPNNTIFYMRYPLEDGFHSKFEIKDYNKGITLYKFTLLEYKQESQFEYVSDDETIKIVKSNVVRDDLLKSTITIACILENMPNYNTSKIITIEKGLVRLEGDKWKIIKKAKIKFENGNDVKFQNKVSQPNQTELIKKIIAPLKTAIINKIIRPLQDKSATSKFFIYYFGAWGVLGIITIVIISVIKCAS